MELVLETQENKSLLKKILYVVVTLLPMAIYMVVYMPTFFWVEGLDHGGNFHIIHTAIDDMIPVIEVFIIPYALWLPYLCAGMIAIAIRSRRISRKTSYMLMTGMTLFIIISLVYPNMLELRAAIPDRQNIFLDMIFVLSTMFIKQHSIIDVISAIVMFIPVFIIICLVIKPVKKEES